MATGPPRRCALNDLQIGVGFDRRDTVGIERIGDIRVAGFHGLQLCIRFDDVGEDDLLDLRCFAPEIGIGNQDDRAVRRPLIDLERTGADRLAIDQVLGVLVGKDAGITGFFLVGGGVGELRPIGIAAEIDDLLTVGDGKRYRGEYGGETRVRRRQGELDGVVVDLLEIRPVVGCQERRLRIGGS